MDKRLKLNIQYFDTSDVTYYSNFYAFGVLVDSVELLEEGSAYRYFWLSRDPGVPVTEDTFVGYRSRQTGIIYQPTASAIGDMPVEAGWSSYDFDAVFNINRLKIDGDQVAEMKIDGDTVQEAKIDGQIVYGNGVY